MTRAAIFLTARPRLRRTPLISGMQRLLLAPAILLAMNACSAVRAGPGFALRARQGFEITVVSSRPDMVTDGDALVRLVLPEGISKAEIDVTLNGADVTTAFRPAANGAGLLGLVTGLSIGSNALSVHYGGAELGRLEIRNHPITGPVFAGPHETPFICQTETFELFGATLGPPLDENCSVARRVYHAYVMKAGGLKLLPEGPSYPLDMARTTTSLGVEVPYIVRVETGTANRGIYVIAMLHDPIGEPEPSPFVRPAGWNHRLIYTLGGGCPGGWYRQGNSTGDVISDFYLRRGYAVVSNSLNVFGNNCSELLAAEAAAVTRERFIEEYGVPLFTIGTGCSGGAYQSFNIPDNYPGIFDGTIAGCSYPDAQFSTTPWNSDGRLLLQYFTGKASMPWSHDQKLAVTGFVNLDILDLIGKPGGHASRVRVGEACSPVLPEGLRYHPLINPQGARCEIFEHHVNVYGRDPETGFVRRPIDNVGVQYGLEALNDGVISKAQFLELNDRVGGYDRDGNVVGERTVGDTIAIRLAYETGRLTNGGGGLAYTPVIDFRGYADRREGGNVHPRFFSFSMKERLLKANGHLDNFVILTADGDRYGLFGLNDPLVQEAFRKMDMWLTRLVQDSSNASRIDKVRRARPSDLVDACWTPREGDAPPTRIAEEQKGSDVSSRCQELYPSGSFARGVAGSSIASDIIKCQLKPIDPSDYRVEFSSEELQRLRSIFPDGVCDWSQRGVGQTGLRGTWLSH